MSAIADVVRRCAQKNIGDIENEWAKFDIDGKAEARFAILKDSPAQIIGDYKATGQKAWIAEFGSGTKMDMKNPGLSKYIYSNKYNRERENFEIRTRKGKYKDLDGVEHEGSGIGGEHGINAERAGLVKAHEPGHVMRDILFKDSVHVQDMKQEILKSFGREVVRREIRRVAP